MYMILSTKTPWTIMKEIDELTFATNVKINGTSRYITIPSNIIKSMKIETGEMIKVTVEKIEG